MKSWKLIWTNELNVCYGMIFVYYGTIFRVSISSHPAARVKPKYCIGQETSMIWYAPGIQHSSVASVLSFMLIIV